MSEDGDDWQPIRDYVRALEDRLDQGQIEAAEPEDATERTVRRSANESISEASQVLWSFRDVIDGARGEPSAESAFNAHGRAEEELMGASEQIEHGLNWERATRKHPNLIELRDETCELIDGVRADFEYVAEMVEDITNH